MRLVRKQLEEPRRDEELEALLVASRAAVEHADLTQALEAILDAALQLVDGDEGSVQMLDKATMTLSIVASRGLDAPARRQVVAVGQGISGTVAVTGQPLLLPSSLDVDRFVGHVHKDRKIYGSLCVPLRAREDTIGVLSLNSMRPGVSFTERDLRLVTLFAETAALTIVNSRLLADTRRHAVELEMLRGAALRLGTSLDLQTVTENALQEALRLASSDAAFICVSIDEGKPLELARYAGLSREALRSVLQSPSFRRLSGPTDVRVVADVSADPVLAPLGPALQGRALALVPLRTADGRSGGVLGVALGRTAGPEVKRLLWTYATQAGLAISNALLHRTVATREEELETIVMTLDLPILLIDEKQRFRAINPAAATIFRLSPDFELGQPVRGKLSPEMEELLLDRDEDATAEAAVGVGADERVFRVNVATVRHGRSTGGRIVVLADVSSQRELEKRKADFLAVVGHELRTPLTSIKGFAWTLAKHGDALKPPVRADAVQTILVQSERLEHLIEDLLYISRVENHRPPLHLVEDDMGAICAGVLAEISRRSPERIIRFEGAAEDVPVTTDRIKVEQILMHLLDNALKYSEEDRPVHVGLTVTEHSVAVAVRDEGCGIYSGDLGRIFEPFTQIDSSSTRRFGGTGVGLYVCATLAEALGGRVDVESVLGKGSTFTLVLPRRSSAGQPADES